MNEKAPGLMQVRLAIDGIDDGLVVLLAARARLTRLAGRLKARAGVQGRDPAREQRVRQRAAHLASALGLAPDVATGVLGLVIGEACRDQGLTTDPDQGNPGGREGMIDATMLPRPDFVTAPAHRLLRLIPPPRRFAPVLRVVPATVQRRMLERAMAKVLSGPLDGGALEFMDGRRLGIEVSDLGLRWVVAMRSGRLLVVDEPAEATVRGTVTDLLLLAGRLEDADTLFFQRRLILTGDTELGLTARNLLDRLPWERVPLGLRIALTRGARFASAARSAHRADEKPST